MRGLRIEIRDFAATDRHGTVLAALDDLSIEPGETVVLCGESGAGKSTFAHALAGQIAPSVSAPAESISVGGHAVLALRGRKLRALRRRIGVVDQDPGSALTPWRTVRQLVSELEAEPGYGRTLSAELGLPADEAWLSRTPASLSGGQRHRVAIARMLAARPELIILDEPTSGLDAKAARNFADLLARTGGAATLGVNDAAPDCTRIIITHDAELAEQLGGRRLDASEGRITVRSATVSSRVLGDSAGGAGVPCAADTLVRAGDGNGAATDSAARRTQRPASSAASAALRLRKLVVSHSPETRTADLDLDVPAGTIVALTGVSGAGKTTVLRAIAGLHAPAAGAIILGSEPLAPDVANRRREHIEALAYLAQDSSLALAPSVPVGRRLHRLAKTHHGDADETIESLALTKSLLKRRPALLSGGQRQRIALAAALLRRPAVLLADEPTSALDAETAELVLERLRVFADVGGAALVASHDPRVIRHADKIIALEKLS